MNSSSPSYVIGIDLGTSHTVVAYAALTAAGDEIALLNIPQRSSAGEVQAQTLLPSVRYQAAAGELGDAWQQPWPPQAASDEAPAVIGRWARDLGTAVPSRLVASAKSWLSHPGVDRSAAILPWGAGDEVAKISPLAASASYLAHVKAAWEQAHPQAPLSAQIVVLTVPASFDEGARALTLEAAQLAGLPQVHLLEEPKAAFHDWLMLQGEQLAARLADSRLVLVVDVGGGTTDLTLIQVEPAADGGLPSLTRTAVGEHLMLGGDNMDLALAHQLEPQFAPEGQRLPAARFAQLVQRCRIAKEQLLAADAPEQVAVTMLGGGSRLLAQSKTASLSRAQVQQWVVEGFLPLAERSALPSKRQGALRGFGLPYPADAAITRHLAQFLAQHAGSGGAQALPDTVLLNGGVFHAHTVVERLTQQLSAWRGAPVRVLHNPHPDWAVARGAAAYGLTRFAPEPQPSAVLPAAADAAVPPVASLRSRLPQIGGGSARSYWLLLPGAKGAAPQGLCLLPRGTQEGVRMVLSGRRFALKLGQAVRFDLLANSLPSQPAQAGQLAPLQGEGWVELPPLATVLPAPEGQNKAQIEVQLQASMTEVGTLEVRCLAVDDPSQSWLLPLSLRGAVQAADDSAAIEDSADEARASLRQEQAIAQIDRIFGNQAQAVDAKEVRQLRQVLERLLGPRNSWDLALLRAMFDALLARAKRRRRTPEHERAWLNLAGWCLRPGLGAQLDAWRVEQVWALYPQGLGHGKEPGNWTEWWVFWRRVAAGLNEAQQMELLEDVAGHMQKAVQQTARKRADGAGGKSSHGSYDDMLRLFAAMEAVPWQYRQEMGQWMLQRLKREGETVQTWWAIGRLAARQPMAANAHLVMPPNAAQEFVQATLAQDWRRNETAMFAALQMARMTGDRARDLPDALRKEVLDKMRSSGAPERWIAMVSEVVAMDAEDQQRSLGDSLPPGLALL
ncbi:hsp70 family protein [Comamonas piscis]|uniref:Hsp70 family protein n=1 Tax=Comamonas piscis TaxID=1562974 RepID=A0A7G5EEN3_9BURK|nr:Hsp70 family protein [Comamonas piscis]QMV72458.1 hsp70 family protein [Comamonas piscis]WSO35227.1 Hsp70 family protein [Comamonas piscis]